MISNDNLLCDVKVKPYFSESDVKQRISLILERLNENKADVANLAGEAVKVGVRQMYTTFAKIEEHNHSYWEFHGDRQELQKDIARCTVTINDELARLTKNYSPSIRSEAEISCLIDDSLDFRDMANDLVREAEKLSSLLTFERCNVYHAEIAQEKAKKASITTLPLLREELHKQLTNAELLLRNAESDAVNSINYLKNQCELPVTVMGEQINCTFDAAEALFVDEKLHSFLHSIRTTFLTGIDGAEFTTKKRVRSTMENEDQSSEDDVEASDKLSVQ